MRHLVEIVLGSVTACGVYVGSFYVLMVPNCRAYNAKDEPAFNNCPRFSENVRVPGPLSIYSGRANFLNYLYFPFEFIHTGPKLKGKPN
jgi:hypothetical protein